MGKRKKEMSLYKKSLLIFTLALLVLGALANLYVYNVLREFDSSNIEKYVNNLAKDIKISAKNKTIEKYIEFPETSSEYEEKTDYEKGYKDLLKDAKMSYKKVSDKKYGIYADDNLIVTVTLKEKEKKKALGLLNYSLWEVEKIDANNKEGIYNLEFLINSDYTLYINGKKASDKDLSKSQEMVEYSGAYESVDLPKYNYYKITNLSMKPSIEIKDKNNNIIEYQVIDNVYTANDFYKTDDEQEAFKHLENKNFKPIEFAEKWSKFLTDDLTGTLHGFYDLEKNLLKGTDLYDKAYAWATNVDITFTSFHTLDANTFTNEKVSNFVVYNDYAFSCDVYLEKHMHLNDGQKKVDVLNDKIYFVYYDGAYRAVYMKSITE